jgi:hypothetical protein
LRSGIICESSERKKSQFRRKRE